MHQELTSGSVVKSMLLFAVPMILGALLQQMYNVADTLIVGQFLGADALAAVGSAYTLMTFLTSVLMGLCMGSSAVFSLRYGAGDRERLKSSIAASFVLIAALSVVLNLIAFLWIDGIMAFLRVPDEVYGLMREYLWVIFFGIFATFLYNFFAALLRSIGNSTIPLIFLGASALLNIGLDLWFILGFDWGVAGAAGATVLSQYLSGVGLMIYVLLRCPQLRPARRHWRLRRETVLEIAHFSVLTCFQQSVMNFGILMVQGLVNSFGPAVMAAFAAAVKIDSFAYMPVQEFGNAFSTFVAQNFGAKDGGRLRVGLKRAVQISIAFCLVITVGVFLLAEPLMRIFVPAGETEIVRIGAQYLRIEGAFYCGIGCLFLFYGFFRGVRAPGISLLLTVVSLGTRVALAYLLAAVPSIGVVGIWWSVPIGWLLADLCGVACYLFRRRRMERMLRPEADGLPQQE